MLGNRVAVVHPGHAAVAEANPVVRAVREGIESFPGDWDLGIVGEILIAAGGRPTGALGLRADRRFEAHVPRRAHLIQFLADPSQHPPVRMLDVEHDGRFLGSERV